MSLSTNAMCHLLQGLPRHARLLPLSAFVLLVMLAVMPPVVAAPAPESFAPLTKELLPSVVNVRADAEGNKAAQQQSQSPQIPRGLEEFFRQFGMPLPNVPRGNGGLPSTSLGSGFIIDDSGIVVTNNHVIANASKVFVTLQSGEEFEAQIIGKDSKTDLAVLAFDSQGQTLTAVPFGNSDEAEVGDWVLAIGNPLGRLGGSVTAGIISARGRNINSGPYDDFIQTDAAINRGNSGGPLFNMQGEVIGINTMILSPNGGSIGIGFSVPSNLAKNVVDQLQEFGSTRRGWLGVQIQELSEEIAESLGQKNLKGAMVSEVTPDGPAEAAGFQIGDLITMFDGKEVESSQKLPILVAQTEVGKEVDVKIFRDGQEKTLSVVLGQLEKAEQKQLAQSDTQKKTKVAEKNMYLGLALSELTDELVERYTIDPYTEGLVVTAVKPGSKAQQMGLMPGVVLEKVNQQYVTTLDEFEEILSDAESSGRKNVLLLIRANGNARFIALPMKE